MHIHLDDISFSFGSRRIFSNVSFSLSATDRTGLIGENGAGKSTLLRILAGDLPPESGRITGGTPRIGLLHQEPPFAPGLTVGEALETALAPARRCLDRLDRAAARLAESPEDAQAAEAYSEALTEAERLCAWEVDAQVAATQEGLRLPTGCTVGSLSGGQRARLSLAWLLLSAPEVLLLDEPTNHLDHRATAYLHEVVAGWPGPVLMASHDRAFLDEAATSLIDLDSSPIATFHGSYSEYLVQREQERHRKERQYREEQDRLKELRASVHRSHSVGKKNWNSRSESRVARKFYADRNATVVSRRVNEAKAKLHDLEERQVRKPRAPLTFRGLDGSRPPRGGILLAAREISVPGRLASTSVTVRSGEKWLVTGDNGTGKSTLLRILAGHLTPASGEVQHPAALRVGFLGQDSTPAPPGITAKDYYARRVGPERAQEVPLESLGLLGGRDTGRPARELSVGQQRRLDLAVVLADPPEVLILDEPTNHLSLRLVEDLEAALREFPGAVVLASHDRWLRRHWTGEVVHLRA